MVEGSHQLDVLGQQHAVAEDVSAHIADARDSEILCLGIDPHFQEVAFHALPGPAGGDAHGLVVVADGAARGERVAEPEPVRQGDIVGDIGEGGGALVGGDNEVGVVAVTAPHSLGGHDRISRAVAVVGDIEQTADEAAVALDALGAERVAVDGGIAGAGRRILDDESALGANRNDDRVLHGLRLDQTQDLGAEVLAAVRPAQPAAGDRAEAQVHSLHPRGVHEDLEAGPWLGQLGDLARVELERQHTVGARRIRLGHKVVGTQSGLDQAEERAQHPVGIQTDHLVDLGEHLGGLGIGQRVVGDGGVEPGFEQFDEIACGLGVIGQDRLDMRLAVGEAGLPEVLGITAQDGDLSSREPGAQHQLVESVDFDTAVPHIVDGVGEQFGAARGALGIEGAGDRRVHHDAECVQRDRQTVRPGEVIRAFFEHIDTHAVQHRQHLAQGGRATTEIHAEHAGAQLVGVIGQVDGVLLQPFDSCDVGNGLCGRHIRLEDLRQDDRVPLRAGAVDR